MCSAALVVSDSLQLYGPYPPRRHCPWDSPGKNTGVGCHALLQGIFPTQGWNPHLDVSCIGSLPLASLPTESLNSPRYNHSLCQNSPASHPPLQPWSYYYYKGLPGFWDCSVTVQWPGQMCLNITQIHFINICSWNICLELTFSWACLHFQTHSPAHKLYDKQ